MLVKLLLEVKKDFDFEYRNLKELSNLINIANRVSQINKRVFKRFISQNKIFYKWMEEEV